MARTQLLVRTWPQACLWRNFGKLRATGARDSGVIDPATLEAVLGMILGSWILDWLTLRACDMAGTEFPEFFLGNFSRAPYHVLAP